MEDELIKIFDRDRNPIGVAAREEIHKQGYWHETFHCWFVSEEEDTPYIFLQKRSHIKKDYPNLLDITAAGHLLAEETIYDGVREIKEELGVDIAFTDLAPLGVLEYSLTRDLLIDNEFAHVFLYKSEFGFNDFIIQEEEVSGIVKAKLAHFSKLLIGEVNAILVEGFEVNKQGHKEKIKKLVGKEDLVPHEHCYYEKVLRLIYQHLQTE